MIDNKARLLKNPQAIKTLIEVWHAMFAGLTEDAYEEGDTRIKSNFDEVFEFLAIALNECKQQR